MKFHPSTEFQSGSPMRPVAPPGAPGAGGGPGLVTFKTSDTQSLDTVEIDQVQARLKRLRRSVKDLQLIHTVLTGGCRNVAGSGRQRRAPVGLRLVVVAVTAAVAACATGTSSPSSPSAPGRSPFPTTNYMASSCDEIAEEIRTLERRIKDVETVLPPYTGCLDATGQPGSASQAGDDCAVGGPTGIRQYEYAKLRAEFDAARDASRRKQCPKPGQ